MGALALMARTYARCSGTAVTVAGALAGSAEEPPPEEGRALDDRDCRNAFSSQRSALTEEADATSVATWTAVAAWAPSVYLKMELEAEYWRASVRILSRPTPALQGN